MQIVTASLQDKPVFRNLMSLYLYDFSEYTGDDVNEIGQFEDEHLERYWTEPNRYPFLVQVAEKYAGFILVRAMAAPGAYQPIYHIAEFFVMKKYRMRGIGRQMACQIFDRFPGEWRVEEMEENLPAQVFWRKVIDEYTGGRYQEISDPDWQGPVQAFHSPGGSR
ncbi:MAG: GNAT family N-acetyltransferase [Chloroflexi bacterium]|nr:MAG: GNAT family N-acetyltransferase [Chloroflexota bacterium]